MSTDIVTIAMEEHIPAGVLGPEPLIMSVNAFLVRHDSGLVLVDTGLAPTGRAIDAALVNLGADWSDVSHIVLTHGHPDHTGALSHVRESAPRAAVLAHPLEGIDGTEGLTDGAVVAGLRAIATPGHTPGHLSLFDEGRETLLVGDSLGVVEGRLVRAPARFTSDTAQAETSLHRLLERRGARMLFSHGHQIDRPWEALDRLLVGD